MLTSRLLLGILIASVALAAAPVAAQEGSWTATGSMATGRYGHTVTVLPNGKVLIAGGVLTNPSAAFRSAELYDPAAGTFADAGLMQNARSMHTATLLPNGKVLLAGGFINSSSNSPLSSAELFDPSTGTFTLTAGTMATARGEHTATLLPNGKVLLVGGTGSGDAPLASAELFDPVTGTFSAAATLPTPRTLHSATRLPDGTVLVVGGLSGLTASSLLASAARYASDGATVTSTGSLSAARYVHAAVLLPTGKVLVAGGRDATVTQLASAELYDPTAGAFSSAGSMLTARSEYVAVLLPNGRALLIGGATATGTASTAASELFNPNDGTFTATGSMSTPRVDHVGAVLPNGKVLITGSIGSATGSINAFASAELYCPDMPGTPGTWTATGSLTTPRNGHAAALLPTGKALIVGGRGGDGYLNSGELYELYGPSAGTFQETANSMPTARGRIVAVRLSSGKVLIAGGEATFDGGALTSADLFDPFANAGAGRFDPTGSMSTGRVGHALTLLPNSQVLVTGGANIGSGPSSFNSAEKYDPVLGTFSPVTATMTDARRFHSATLLPNGTILIIGGVNGSGATSIVHATAEIFDPLANDGAGAFTATGSLTTGRYGHTATLLADGRVLIAAGFVRNAAGAGIPTSTAEIFDPATGTFSPTGSLTAPRTNHAAVLLPNGQVLIVGPDTITQLFDPSTGTFTATGSMATGRVDNTATLLPTGQVLAAGANPAERYSLEICKGNTPPVARDDAFSVFENVTLTGRNVLSNDSDPDEDPLTAVLVNGVTSGTLNLRTDGTFTYTPAPNFIGNVTFTYKANDGHADSNIATVSITVNPNTTATVVSVPTIAAGATVTQSLGDILLTENTAGALVTGGPIFVELPSCVRFATGTLPTVSIVVGSGIAVDPESLRIDPDNNRRFSFAISSPSTGGPATLRISGLAVTAAGCETAGAVNTTVNGAAVQTATAVFSSTTPTVADVSPATGGQGALSVGASVEGANFSAGAKVCFGSFNTNGNCTATDVAVTGETVNATGTRIAFALSVGPAAVPGPRDIRVRNAGGQISEPLIGAFLVTAAPSVTSTDRQGMFAFGGGSCPNALIRGVPNQRVNISGSNFLPPTTSLLQVRFSVPAGSDTSGITAVGPVIYDAPDRIHLDVNVDPTTPLSSRQVTVLNPDGGIGTSATAIAELVDPAPSPPCPAVAVGGPTPSIGTSGSTTPPTLTSLSTNRGRIGSTVTLTGTGFSTTASSVTFAGVGNTRVPATVNSNATVSTLSVIVPANAIDGEITVMVSGLVSIPVCGTPNCTFFTVTDPKISNVVPATVTTGNTLSQIVISGTKFESGPTVLFSPSVPFTPSTFNAVASLDGSQITLTPSGGATQFTIGQAIGSFDVTVRNPNDHGSATRSATFQVKAPEAVALRLLRTDGVDVTSTFLPTVQGVTVTVNSNGTCSSAVTPSEVTLRAAVAGTNPPASVRFTIAAVSANTGTATNEDCDSAIPRDDFELVGGPTSRQATVQGAGTYDVILRSFDFGGTVTILAEGLDINGNVVAAVAGTRSFPDDADGDGLPDFFEDCQTDCGIRDADRHSNGRGVGNVLNRLSAFTTIGTTVVPTGGNDKTAADGLTNVAKYRGVYLKVTQTSSNVFVFSGADHTRLGAGMKQFFVRGRGFAGDPLITANFCGVTPDLANLADGAATPLQETDTTGIPCPFFEVGEAFRSAGIKVQDVTTSFSASSNTPATFPRTIFPRQSFKFPTKNLVDMATVIYDATNCAVGSSCDHTGKPGARQWNFPTLANSSIGGTSLNDPSVIVYGVARIAKKAIDAIFRDLPYQHRLNDPTRVVTCTDPVQGPRACLAPITKVGDNSSTGADNGSIERKEATVVVNGVTQLAGDTYIFNSYNEQLSAMDVNADRCMELPFVGDPTSLDAAGNSLNKKCDKTLRSATFPQATKQQIMRHVTTHELCHVTGCSASHTTDPTDLQYQYTINWVRDGHFSPTSVGQIQIHNGGVQ